MIRYEGHDPLADLFDQRAADLATEECHGCDAWPARLDPATMLCEACTERRALVAALTAERLLPTPALDSLWDDPDDQAARRAALLRAVKASERHPLRGRPDPVWVRRGLVYVDANQLEVA
jgi:hypothetical protein